MDVANAEAQLNNLIEKRAKANGKAQETSAILLDWCGAGLLLSIGCGKVLLPWERLAMAELVED